MKLNEEERQIMVNLEYEKDRIMSRQVYFLLMHPNCM